MSSNSDSYDHGSGIDTESPKDTRNPGPETTQAAIDALNRPKQANKHDGTFSFPSKDSLPGRGAKYDDCGSPLDFICENCGDTTEGSRRCRRSMCPECWESWARKSATEKGSRLLALRALQDAKLDEHVKLHHITMSLPFDRTYATDDPDVATERAIDSVRDFLHALNIPAVVIYHPYRIADQKVGWGMDSDWTDKQGEWKSILNQGRFMRDIDDQLKFGPHFHIIAVASWFPGQEFTEKLHEETGWVMKRITKQDNNASIYDNEDLAAVLSYSLSHAGMYEDSNGDYRERVRYIGKNSIWDQVTVHDHYKADFDRTVRQVAPRTLGIPFRDLACHTDIIGPAALQVDITAARAAAARADDSSSAGDTDLPDDTNDDVTGEVEIGAGNTGYDDATTLPDDPGSRMELGEAEPCYGRLLPPWEAAELVEDEEWLAKAEYPDRARAAVRGYYAKKDGPPA